MEGYKQKWPKLHRGTNGKSVYLSSGFPHIGVFAICKPIYVASFLFVAFQMVPSFHKECSHAKNPKMT